MKIFGKELTLFKQKQLPQSLSPAFSSGAGGWFNAIFPFAVREADSGDWQRNICLSMECLLSNPIVFSCITLIAGDIGKLRPQLMKYIDSDEIYVEAESPAFSPVLAHPNHYQNRIEFFTQWVISLLSFGNTYVLKQRDQRGVVTQLYVLDPRRVLPLIATTGDVFYQLSQDNLLDIGMQITVPASEIIHDKINCIFHPLIGLSPLFGCAMAATQAIEMQRNSTRFFRKGATPSGVITIPGSVDKEKALKIKEAWAGGFTGANSGAVAVLADGARFEQMTMTSVDAELVNQMKMTGEQICSCFHVPGYMIGVGTSPTYNNIEALNQQYYNQCLQVLIEKIELCMTEGLRVDPYSICFDLKQLLRMDTAARYTSNTAAITGGWLAPNEARQGENLKKVEGGDTPYLQQQNFSLEDLNKRSQLPNPFIIDKPTTNPTPAAAGPAATVDPAATPPAKAIEQSFMRLEREFADYRKAQAEAIANALATEQAAEEARKEFAQAMHDEVDAKPLDLISLFDKAA